MILLLLIGAVCLGAGVATYFLMLITGCFTCDFTRPFWKAAKVKIFAANLIVFTGLVVGIGLIATAFLGSFLQGAGPSGSTSQLLVFCGVIVALQAFQVWIVIWAPVEKRLVIKRLMAQGLTREQLQSGLLIGLSNPASGFSKRFSAIEEDMGVLWIGQNELVYRGDDDHFAISRSDLIQVERRADTRSTTMLAGIVHIILHFRIPDGSIRQVRLHIEGVLTMGQKRKAMDWLAQAIESWRATAPVGTLI
jgi:hypothetical protein